MQGHFSHFTRETLSLSREEAIRLGHDAIGPEHLLLGILRLGNGTAVNVLRNCGCDLDTLRDLIEAQQAPGTASHRDLPLTRSAERILKGTAAEAERYGSAMLGTEHLLLSLLRDPDNPAARLLHDECGVTYRAARDVVDEMTDYTPDDEPDDEASALDRLIHSFDTILTERAKPTSGFRSSASIHAPEAPVELQVAEVEAHPARGGVYELILREQHGPRRLSFEIGPFEAQAIAMERDGVRPPRPMTHDLLRLLAEAGDVSIRAVCLDAWRHDTHYSYLDVETSHGPVRVDARPSDAVALALRVGCPILASASLLTDA